MLRRRYVPLGFIVDEQKDALACILACLWFAGSGHPIDGQPFRFGTAHPGGQGLCHPGFRTEIRHAVFGLSRSLAQAEQFWPDVQRQRLPNGERSRRSHLPAAGLLAWVVSHYAALASSDS